MSRARAMPGQVNLGQFLARSRLTPSCADFGVAGRLLPATRPSQHVRVLQSQGWSSGQNCARLTYLAIMRISPWYGIRPPGRRAVPSSLRSAPLRRRADPRLQPWQRFRPRRSERWPRRVGSSAKASTIRGSTRSSSRCQSPGVAPLSSTQADSTASTPASMRSGSTTTSMAGAGPRTHVQEAKPRVSSLGVRCGRRGHRSRSAS